MTDKRNPTPDQPHCKQVRTLKVGDRIEIRRRWWHPMVWIIVPFLVSWWTAIFLTTALNLDAWPQFLFVIVIALIPTYGPLAVWLNETRLYVEDGVLHAITGPVPFHLPRRLDASDISAVRIELQSKIGWQKTYRLKAKTAKGDTKLIVGHILGKKDAHFIANELAFILAEVPVHNESEIPA